MLRVLKCAWVPNVLGYWNMLEVLKCVWGTEMCLRYWNMLEVLKHAWVLKRAWVLKHVLGTETCLGTEMCFGYWNVLGYSYMLWYWNVLGYWNSIEADAPGVSTTSVNPTLNQINNNSCPLGVSGLKTFINVPMLRTVIVKMYVFSSGLCASSCLFLVWLFGVTISFVILPFASCSCVFDVGAFGEIPNSLVTYLNYFLDFNWMRFCFRL